MNQDLVGIVPSARRQSWGAQILKYYTTRFAGREKFSVGLPEHVFHPHEADSMKKSVPIPRLSEEEAKYSELPKY